MADQGRRDISADQIDWRDGAEPGIPTLASASTKPHPAA